NNTVRRVKTDRKDAIKIARYGLDNWDELREYIPQGIIRQQLKMFSRQYNLSIKTIRALENNLISLLDKTFPGLNKLFASRKRKDGRQKWVDFAQAYWHTEAIIQMDEQAFIKSYQSWCEETGYQFKATKAKEVYAHCQGHLTTLPNNANTGLLITTAADQVTSISVGLAAIKAEMTRLAALLPEHEIVINLYGVGELTAAQLIAEIGDVRRFRKRGSLTAYAGIDPLPQQSGKYEKKSNPTSKRGSAPLRKTLFQVVCAHLRRSPPQEPVFQFLDKKRAEGKPYFVYMTAAANKFLRIYYARVKLALEASG
ncbi:MAG: IS110 family transposase, partial [Defluviitaleaceae bacterium]|nr:IS110 family transposase [Defluviitaleaceae bacterium]